MSFTQITAKGAAGQPAAEDTIHQLQDLDIPFISLVDRGANRQRKFLMVKQDDGPAADHPAVDADAIVTKVVPDADAPDEEKRAAQANRAEEYGIEVLPDNSNLTYPAGAPTTERLYGDPVNLKYPLGGEDDAADPARTRNALARFKQASGAYTDAGSRRAVYRRIVEQALALGIAVSYDPEDPVDALLPEALVTQITGDAEKRGIDDWLTKATRDVDDLITAVKLAPPAVPREQPPAPQAAPRASGPDPAALQAEIEKLQAAQAAQARDLEQARVDLRKAHLAATRRHQSAVGAPAGLRPRTSALRPSPATPPGDDPVRAWRTGTTIKPRTSKE